MGHEPLAMEPPRPKEMPIALLLASMGLPPEQRVGRLHALAEEIRRGRVDCGSFLVARRGDDLCGAIYVERQPGGSAVVWPPGVAEGQGDDLKRPLLDAMTASVFRDGTQVVHLLLESPDSPEACLAEASGFVFLAELMYLASQEIHFPMEDPSAGGVLTFEPYEESQQERLARLVDQTYVETLDCPALNGVRPTRDVLAGYRATGTFRPDLWMFAKHDQRDVGCLLLADHPATGNCELVYMGFLPDVRGRGWGRLLASQAQWRARQASRQLLIVAVDAKNTPARRVYGSVGFVPWDRKAVYLKRQSAPQGGTVLAPEVTVVDTGWMFDSTAAPHGAD